MKTTKYDENDLLPITLATLRTSLQTYLCNALKLVIDREYPELKGNVATDCIDRHALELLDELDNEWFSVIRNSLAAIDKTMNSLANINALDMQVVCADQRIQDLAHELFCAQIADEFFYDGEESHNEQDLADVMRLFTWSLTGVIQCLLDVLITQHYQAGINYSSLWGYTVIRGNYDQHKHRISLSLLDELGHELSSDFRKLSEIEI